MVRLSAILLCLIAAPGVGFAQPKTGAKVPPTPPEDVVKAWKAAGADFGWNELEEDEVARWLFAFRTTPGAYWTIILSKAPKDGWAALPAPKQDFFLYLVGDKFTDENVKGIGAFTQMAAVNLFGSKVTDASMKEIAGLNRLVALTVAHTKITDDGLKHVSGLKMLKEIDLYGTQVTDKGLLILAECKQLTAIDVKKTKATPEGVKKLREALPKALIRG